VFTFLEYGCLLVVGGGSVCVCVCVSVCVFCGAASEPVRQCEHRASVFEGATLCLWLCVFEYPRGCSIATG